MAAPSADPPRTALSVNQSARRQRIVDTALAMIGEQDYERIQVRDVADASSVALGTLYHYFPSKEQLFGEALIQWAGTLESSTASATRTMRSASPGSMPSSAAR